MLLFSALSIILSRHFNEVKEILSWVGHKDISFNGLWNLMIKSKSAHHAYTSQLKSLLRFKHQAHILLNNTAWTQKGFAALCVRILVSVYFLSNKQDGYLSHIPIAFHFFKYIHINYNIHLYRWEKVKWADLAARKKITILAVRNLQRISQTSHLT